MPEQDIDGYRSQVSFRTELDAHIAEIRELAWEKRRAQWALDLLAASAAASPSGAYQRSNYDVEPVDRWVEVECDFGVDLNERLNRFYPFGDPDRDEFQVMINGLNDHLQLDSLTTRESPDYIAYPGVWDHIEIAATQNIPGVAALLEDWGGTASENFYLNFMNPFPGAAGHQLGLVQELGRILRAYQRVVVDAQTDITTIAENTKAALRDLYDGDGEGFSEFTLVVMGAVANVAGAVVLESAIAVLGAWQLANRQPDRSGDPLSISGDTVDAILDKTNAAINVLVQSIDEEENLIQAALEVALDRVELELGSFLAEDPYLTTNLSEFDDPDKTQTVLDMAKLYQAGKVEMSAAAYNYDRAARRLRLSTGVENNAFGSWFVRSIANWKRLHERFEERILGATRDRMIEYGNALCQAANEYAGTDDRVRAMMDQFDTNMETALPKDTLNNQPVVPQIRVGGPM